MQAQSSAGLFSALSEEGREPVVLQPLWGTVLGCRPLACVMENLSWGSRHMCFRSVLIASASEALISCKQIFAESFELMHLLRQWSHDQMKLVGPLLACGHIFLQT